MIYFTIFLFRTCTIDEHGQRFWQKKKKQDNRSGPCTFTNTFMRKRASKSTTFGYCNSGDTVRTLRYFVNFLFDSFIFKRIGPQKFYLRSFLRMAELRRTGLVNHNVELSWFTVKLFVFIPDFNLTFWQVNIISLNLEVPNIRKLT